MSDDHTFIDAHGNEVSGKEKMIAGWRVYFEWFPDYYIEVTDVFEDGEKLALFGFAGGSFKNKEGQSWRLPTAWKASVKDGRKDLKARGDMKTVGARQNHLDVVPSEPPPRHANLVGWPSEKSEQMLIAEELAAIASLKLKDGA